MIVLYSELRFEVERYLQSKIDEAQNSSVPQQFFALSGLSIVEIQRAITDLCWNPNSGLAVLMRYRDLTPHYKKEEVSRITSLITGLEEEIRYRRWLAEKNHPRRQKK